jgi:Domain of unknown function (DUF4352)/Protein of unknown function (DUF2510)
MDRHNDSVTVTTDGYLPAALDRLYTAVAVLIDPVKEMHDDAIMSGPSLYEQLVGAITTAKCESLGRRAGRSMPPVWTDALDLMCPGESDYAKFVWGQRAWTVTTPTPPGWYPDPSGAPGTRYWDGKSWTITQPRYPVPALTPALRKRRVGPWIILIGVPMLFFGGCSALIFIGAAVGNHNAGKPSLSAPSTPTMPSVSVQAAPTLPSPTVATTTAAPTAGVGQEARDGKFAFTVTSVDRSKQAGDVNNPYMTVTAQGEFLNVHMTVANTGNHAQTFFATNQHLKIGNNTYDANGSAAMWTHAMSQDVNPGNSIQVVVSFDVPPGSGGGVLQLHDSMFSGGVKVALQ